MLLLRLLFLGGLLSVSLSLSVPAIALELEMQVQPNMPSIRTRGDAQINVNPDVFLVVVGVETVDKDLDKAYDLNGRAGAAVLAVAKKHKVKREDVQTSQFTVRPDYDGGSFKGSHTVKQIESFHVKRTMSFKFGDSALLEPILKDAVAAGANHIEQVSFETSELRRHKDAARILAFKAAREKAELLASESGCKLGKVQRIDETQHDYYHPNNNIQNTLSQPTVESGGGIAIGLIPIKASIIATFELTQ